MVDPQIISILLGLFVGLVLALTGAGGSVIAVPLLAFFLNLSILQAAPIGLIAVTFAATIGALHGLQAGIVRYKAAALMAAFGVLLAPAGVWFAHRIPNQWLHLVFSVVLIAVAWRIWKQDLTTSTKAEENPAFACAVNPATSKLFWTASCTKRLIAVGSLSGFLSGLLGVGGGFVIVPTLREFSNLALNAIVATSLAIIALVSAVSVASYMLHGQINWQIAMPFMLATATGMLAGRTLAGKLSSQFTQRSFAILAWLIAAMLIYQWVNITLFGS